MAVVNTKSTQIANADASPAVINTAQVAQGRVLHKRGKIEAVSGDSIGSVYRAFRVKSNDLMHQLLLHCTAITTCAADIGLYRTAADGGAVVDADLFASAQSLATALTGTDVTRESGVITVPNIEKPLWELAGLTEDPQCEYDVALTLTAAAGSAGTVALAGLVVGRT